MGTSGSSSGSGSGTPLVPSWLGGSGGPPLPGGPGAGEDGDADGGDGDQGAPPNGPDNDQLPPMPPPAQPDRFRTARTNFSRFAGSAGTDGRALRRGVRDYVRHGTGGTRNAVRRMETSRAAAGNALGVFRGFERDGVEETLRRIRLDQLAGRSVRDVFVGLTEVVCDDGGSVDETIARDAWLETIAELGELGIEDVETLSLEQIREVFLSFVAHTIEARLYQEIGVNGFRFSDEIDDIEQFDAEFRNYIERSVRDAFSGDLSNLSDMTDNSIREVVDSTYQETWDLLELLGDREG